MSRPKMALAALSAAAGESASLTPPALPRPPVLTCALTTTVLPYFSAAPLASAAVRATVPGVTGTPCLAKRSFAWYSNRSTEDFPSTHAATWRAYLEVTQALETTPRRTLHQWGPLLLRTCPAPSPWAAGRGNPPALRHAPH